MNNPKQARLIKLFVSLSIVGVIGYGMHMWRQYQADEKNRISYTAFIDKVNAGEILKVRIEGDAIIADGKSGAKFLLFRPMDAELSKLLLEKHIDLSAKPLAAQSRWIELGFVLVVLVPVFLIMKRLAVFGRSKAKLIDGSESKTLFTDVAGAEEAKAELLETVDFLKDSDEVHQARRENADRRAARGPSGYGENAPGASRSR